MTGGEPGHCRHCSRYCQGSAEEEGMVWVIAAQRHHDRLAVAEWDDGGCPMCAEAERIAAAIEAEAQRLAAEFDLDTSRIREYCGPDADALVGMLDAAAIARGET